MFVLFFGGFGGEVGEKGCVMFFLQITMVVLYEATSFDHLHLEYLSCYCTYYLLFFNIFHYREWQVSLSVIFVLCYE